MPFKFCLTHVQGSVVGHVTAVPSLLVPALPCEQKNAAHTAQAQLSPKLPRVTNATYAPNLAPRFAPTKPCAWWHRGRLQTRYVPQEGQTAATARMHRVMI